MTGCVVLARDGRAALTLEWAPGRLADHGLTGGGP